LSGNCYAGIGASVFPARPVEPETAAATVAAVALNKLLAIPFKLVQSSGDFDPDCFSSDGLQPHSGKFLLLNSRRNCISF
jgi:hypothetical protein